MDDPLYFIQQAMNKGSDMESYSIPIIAYNNEVSGD